MGSRVFREAEIVNIPFLGALAGCSARRSERRVASHTSEEQRRNAPGRASNNCVLDAYIKPEGLLDVRPSVRAKARSVKPANWRRCKGLMRVMAALQIDTRLACTFTLIAPMEAISA